ncbi:hypothetical protein AB0J40_28670 [Amycolatopsis sp. NPDC049691]|uniref:enoyl-CoA hydratase/isomerase family protein n=1 Tax=Amycolatopsis sp. NPDC049691 TaxID=3155155 RepID=UPI0034439BB3
MPRLVGRERALDLILSGREFSGAEAVAWGLALSDHPGPEVLAAASEYAEQVARTPRAGIGYVKAAVDERDRNRSLRLAGLGQAACIRQAVLPD